MTFLPTNDPVGGAVFLGMLVFLLAFGLWFVLNYLRVSKETMRIADRFVSCAGIGCGLILLWAATTIDVPVVPLIIASLGLFMSAFGIFGLKRLGAPRNSRK